MDNKALHAYRLLRKMLVELDLEPGTPLDERRLSGLLDVGRTPVREALQRLATEGLVVVVPRKGTFAAPITVSLVRQVYECRIGFEGYAARLAALKASDEELAQLAALLPAAEAAVARNNVFEIAEIDFQMHRHLWSLARNASLQAILEDFYARGHRIWKYTFRHGLHAKAHNEMADEWATIVSALQGRSCIQAQRAMEEHIAHVTRIVTDSNWFKNMTPDRDPDSTDVLL